MVYKSEILRGIVNIDENEGKICFNCDAMNTKQKDLFDNYKREIVRESISIASGCIKMDDTLMDALNSNNVVLNLKNLNSKQTFLLDCCIKELERKIDPEVYKEHKQGLKRKRNNECASKFRKKRKNYEKINEIIRTHLNELAKHCKGNLSKEHIEKIRLFLNENKLNITLKYFDEDSCVNKSLNECSTSSIKSNSVMSSNSSENSNSSDSASENSNDSMRTEVQKMYINKNNIKNNINDELLKEEPRIQNCKVPIAPNIQVERPVNPIIGNFSSLNPLFAQQILASYGNQFSTYPLQQQQQQHHHQQQQQQQASSGIFTPVIIVPHPYSPGEYQLLLNPLVNNQRFVIK
jgi:hypothetical protein